MIDVVMYRLDGVMKNILDDILTDILDDAHQQDEELIYLHT